MSEQATGHIRSVSNSARLCPPMTATATARAQALTGAAQEGLDDCGLLQGSPRISPLRPYVRSLLYRSPLWATVLCQTAVSRDPDAIAPHPSRPGLASQ